MELKIKKVERTKVGDYIVNTTMVNNEYETAIRLGNKDYIVVQRYSTITHAEIGHKHWCEFCETNPIYATDITTNQKKLF